VVTCVCVSVCGRMPTLLHGPRRKLGSGRGCRIVVHYWADLELVHGFCCYGNTRNAWQSPAVIRQAHHTQCHALRMPAKTPVASDNIDAPAALFAIPFLPYCGGVVMRNVSEYTLVLAVCLVGICEQYFVSTLFVAGLSCD